MDFFRLVCAALTEVRFVRAWVHVPVDNTCSCLLVTCVGLGGVYLARSWVNVPVFSALLVPLFAIAAFVHRSSRRASGGVGSALVRVSGSSSIPIHPPLTPSAVDMPVRAFLRSLPPSPVVTATPFPAQSSPLMIPEFEHHTACIGKLIDPGSPFRPRSPPFIHHTMAVHFLSSPPPPPPSAPSPPPPSFDALMACVDYQERCLRELGIGQGSSGISSYPPRTPRRLLFPPRSPTLDSFISSDHPGESLTNPFISSPRPTSPSGTVSSPVPSFDALMSRIEDQQRALHKRGLISRPAPSPSPTPSSSPTPSPSSPPPLSTHLRSPDTMDRNMAAMIAKSKESDRLYEAKLAQLKELVAGMTFRPATPEKSYDYSEWSPTPITISDFEPTVFPSDASFSYTRSPTHSPLLAIPSSVAEWDHPAFASSPSLSAVAESDTPSSASASSPSPAPSSLRDEDIAALQRFARNVHTNILSKSGKSLPPSWEPPSFTGPYLAPSSPRPPSPPPPRPKRIVRISRRNHRLIR
ncbi:hypothetical protein CcaCcLH18_02568 [Colletotrichum camelliae]|nr:hypothetical protein CcaCcLH18_02568 [Colletotrichum camelliae]